MPVTTALFIGIMSGTSADGIDVAIVAIESQSNKHPHSKLIQFSEFPMPAPLRQSILHLAVSKHAGIEAIAQLDRKLGQAYADAALSTIQQAGLQNTDIAAIGCHGQTIRHRPQAEPPFSLQIGCAATLAELSGITAVTDFRSRDIAAGGEGAPLVPFAHQQLFASQPFASHRPLIAASQQQNTAIINIGGIANLTWLGTDGTVTGFDTGPGNMIMDALMLAISDGHDAFDRDGNLAASGQVCLALLDQLMAQPFFKRRPPKSTGREIFGDDFTQQIMAWPDISNADRMATACQLTADTIMQSLKFINQPTDACFICGGGARNVHLMGLLQQQLNPRPLQSTDAAGIPAQAVEAISFALLARHTLMGKPNTLSQVTGATHDVCGGQITPGSNWSALLRDIPTWTR
ncbi:MAG: anhydro-N-acetylmuramic acid kinase [Mariprofundus sp.]|nr:anhydro-N-acetylmuramic acid kinase [Mariprofundus sp.]